MTLLLAAGFALADVMPLTIAREKATPAPARALDAVPLGRADRAFEPAHTGVPRPCAGDAGGVARAGRRSAAAVPGTGKGGPVPELTHTRPTPRRTAPPPPPAPGA
ncbi:hypothetical protein JQK87_13270 [Streptomyces sp. G44]|nr:hypothetical protein [Streptomyces sp. G44]